MGSNYIAVLIFSSLASYCIINCKEAPNMVVREHMGVVFQKVAILDNSVSFWSHTIAVRVPDLEDMKVQKPICNRKVHPEHKGLMIALCEIYKDVFDSYDDVRRKLCKEVDEKAEIMDQLIPVADINIPSGNSRRIARAPLEFIGKISRNLFATATLEDINVLKEHIQALENNPKQFNGFQKFATTLSSLQIEINKNLKIVTDGVRQNKMLMNETFQEINNMHSSIEEVLDKVEVQFRLLTRVITIMHGISAREINTMFLALSELDKMIDSYTSLLKGYLPLQIITPQRIKDILANVGEHLKTDFPTFRILHETPSVYYNLPGIVSYTKTRNHLYIKFRIPITSSDLLYNVYALKSIPITTGKPPNVSFTQIRDLPAYLGVTQDNKFFVELDQAAFESCPGNNFKQCSNFLRVFRSSEPTCSSALFNHEIDNIHSQCKVSLYPYPSDQRTFFIDLQDDRVLISTLDRKWIRSCHQKPSQTIEGCSNCILSKSCDCTLSSKSFYMTTSIHSCLAQDESETIVIPNYLTSVSYLKIVEPNISFTNDNSLEKLRKIDFHLPPLIMNQSKWSETASKFQVEECRVDLQQTMNSLANNKTIYFKPFDAWLNDHKLPTLATATSIADYVSYIIPIFVIAQTIVLIRLYRRHLAMEGFINRVLPQNYPELLTFSALVDQTSSLPPENPIQKLSLSSPITYLLWALTCTAILYLLLRITKFLYRIITGNKEDMNKALNSRRTWLQMILTNGTYKMSLKVCELCLPMQDIVYVTPSRPVYPDITVSNLRPYLRTSFNYLVLNSLTNSSMRLELPKLIPIGIIQALKYRLMKRGPAVMEILLYTSNEAKQILPAPLSNRPVLYQIKDVPIKVYSLAKRDNPDDFDEVGETSSCP